VLVFLLVLMHVLINASYVLLKLKVDYIERVTGMTTDELVTVSDGTAIKQFLLT